MIKQFLPDSSFNFELFVLVHSERCIILLHHGCIHHVYARFPLDPRFLLPIDWSSKTVNRFFSSSLFLSWCASWIMTEPMIVSRKKLHRLVSIMIVSIRTRARTINIAFFFVAWKENAARWFFLRSLLGNRWFASCARAETYTRAL